MADGNRTTLGATIRAELARQERSQVQLARELGRSQPWVSRRLRGVRHFTVIEVEHIARFLGVPLSTFIPTEERDSA